MARKKRKKPKKAGPLDKFLGLILILAAFALAGFIGWKTLQNAEKQRNWTRTTASTKFQQSFNTSTSRGTFKTNVLSIEYEANGSLYKSQITGKGSGGKVDIYYNPDKPGEATHAGRLESRSQLWFLIACPFLFLAGHGVMTDGRDPDWEALKQEADAKAAAAKARKRKRKGKRKTPRK
ncbi:MAG: DUF3592 domain-containing protein [Phycisphaerales bacterium JB037]